MNKQVKDKWIKALLSKKYKKGKGYLKIKTKNGIVKHCVLGVLCDLHAKEFKNKWNRDKDGHAHYLASCAILPDEVKDWAELPNTNPHAIANMNDQKGITFKKLAEYIEKNF